MNVIKKKDVKKYQFTDLLDSKKEKEGECEECELDELVGATGAPIGGDEPGNSRSEVHTAPQATTDDFSLTAIQPNRYLYNVGGSGYSRGANINTVEAVDKLAKNKLLKLLENISDEPITDNNGDAVNDIKELPSNIINKLENLINGIKNSNLDGRKCEIIIGYITDKLKDRMNNA